MADYKINSIYQGGFSSLSPTYGEEFIGYRTKAGSFGLTTDPRSSNFLKEVSLKLQAGVKQIEVEGVNPQVFDSVPKQHLKEINRLSKLTGVGISLHGPVINTTGVGQQSFSEMDREASERVITDALMRGHELDPEGNVPVNFHSAEGIPGTQYNPEYDPSKGIPEHAKLLVINKETGRIAPLEPEIKYYPQMKKELSESNMEKARRGEISEEEIEKLQPEIPLEKGKHYSPEERMDVLNKTEWDNSISQLLFNKERADEILQNNRMQIAHLLAGVDKKGQINPKILAKFPEQKQAYDHYRNAKNYLDDVHQQAYGIFSRAYEYGDEEQKKNLKIISDEFKKALDKDESIFGQSKAMNDLLHTLKQGQLAPNVYVPIETFAVNQSSKTYGNATFEAYKKFKDKSPITLIENPPAGFALSTGEDLKKLVIKSREQFVNRASMSKNKGGLGLSESDAKKQAEKLIGATWDVGHINMLRKFGYKEKDIVKETEKIAPFVKHIHLSDNFGLEHTELPMGMGNVPLKEMMERLGEKGFEARKIIEAGGLWWQHFGTPPFQEVLETFGSPIYAMENGPYWNQSLGLQQGYLGGLEGNWLPQINYETFGTGFSQLPKELGGQKPGAGGSRMSGRPME